MTASRDGGLQNMEVHGMIMLKITDEAKGRCKVLLDNVDKALQLQVCVMTLTFTFYFCRS